MQIQLSWNDPIAGLQQSQLATPIAIGSNPTVLPQAVNGQAVSPLLLAGHNVAAYHALIEERDGEISITDQGSSSGSQVNGVALPSSTLVAGDRLTIGDYTMTVQFGSSPASRSSANEAAVGCDRQVGFLFKRRCGRTSTSGCPHCDEGRAADDYDPYFYEHNYYPGYGLYTRGYWGSNYYYERDRYSYDPDTRSIDFTEADAEAFEQEGDMDYEQSFDAS